jgi:hypothetical protein
MGLCGASGVRPVVYSAVLGAALLASSTCRRGRLCVMWPCGLAELPSLRPSLTPFAGWCDGFNYPYACNLPVPASGGALATLTLLSADAIMAGAESAGARRSGGAGLLVAAVAAVATARRAFG